jgi:hypothetical protein
MSSPNLNLKAFMQSSRTAWRGVGDKAGQRLRKEKHFAVTLRLCAFAFGVPNLPRNVNL